MNRLKLILVLTVLSGVMLLLSLPNSVDSGFIDSKKLEEFSKLPDYDFRQEAERFCKMTSRRPPFFCLNR